LEEALQECLAPPTPCACIALATRSRATFRPTPRSGSPPRRWPSTLPDQTCQRLDAQESVQRLTSFAPASQARYPGSDSNRHCCRPEFEFAPASQARYPGSDSNRHWMVFETIASAVGLPGLPPGFRQGLEFGGQSTGPGRLPACRTIAEALRGSQRLQISPGHDNRDLRKIRQPLHPGRRRVPSRARRGSPDLAS
jgi:hypothetical protein